MSVVRELLTDREIKRVKSLSLKQKKYLREGFQLYRKLGGDKIWQAIKDHCFCPEEPWRDAQRNRCKPGTCKTGGVCKMGIDLMKNWLQYTQMNMGYGIRRLMRDLKLVKKYPLRNVVAAPIDSKDFFLWHANIRAPSHSKFRGGIFHLELLFPFNYPTSPPTIKLLTNIPYHPNVFGDYICLDLLHDPLDLSDEEIKELASNPRGWTAAYTVQSVLVQLQTFLFKSHIEHCRARVVDVIKDNKKDLGIVIENDINGQLQEVYAFNPYAFGKTLRLKKLPTKGNIVSVSYRGISRKNNSLENCTIEHFYNSGSDEELWKQVKKYRQQVLKWENKYIARAVTHANKYNCGKVNAVGCVHHGSKHPSPAFSMKLFEEEFGDVRGRLVGIDSKHGSIQSKKNRQEGVVKLSVGEKFDNKVKELEESTREGKVLTVSAREEVDVTKSDEWKQKDERHKNLKQQEIERAEQDYIETEAAAGDVPEMPVLARQVSEEGRFVIPEVDLEEEEEKFVVGSWHDGVISKVFSSGIKIACGWEDFAFCPLTELRPGRIYDIYEEDVYPGKPVKCRVLDLSSGFRRQLLVSLKPEIDPIDLTTLTEGTTIQGVITNVTHFGVFVDFGASFQGLLPMSEVRKCFHKKQIWTPKQCGIGKSSKIDVRVLSLDIEKNRISFAPGINLKKRFHAMDTYDIVNSPLAHLSADGQDNLGESISNSLFNIIGDSAISHVFSFCDPKKDLPKIRKTCLLFKKLIDNSRSLFHVEEELVCFHSRRSYNSVVLGYPLNVERYENNNVISGITPTLDGYLSFDSFFHHRVRRSVWQKMFTHWLPIYINPEHGKRALPLAKEAIASMMLNRQMGTNEFQSEFFHPLQVLKVLPALLNTMVVNTMNGELHESIVALEGYTAFWHLFSAFMLQYPELQRLVDEKIETFLESKKGRHKRQIPALGEFLAYLSLSSRYTWADVRYDYLDENFDRHVKWTLKKYPELLHGGENRIEKTFKANVVSLKLIVFHVFFLKLFRQDPRDPHKILSVFKVKKRLDQSHGKPTKSMVDNLQVAVKRIKELSTWKEFFNACGVPPPPGDYLYHWLIRSMENSARRRYHREHLLKGDRQKEMDVVAMNKLLAAQQNMSNKKKRNKKAAVGADEHQQYYDMVKDSRSSRW